MKFIGNFSNWIDPEWVNYIMNNTGMERPGKSVNPDTEEFRKATASGYDLSKTYWHSYDTRSFPFNVTLPFKTDTIEQWWFIKMMPGNFMPIHRDVFLPERKNYTRYWMPLQDYQPGHIFVYDKLFVTDYKAGDMWVYDDPDTLHGACNIGYTPRLTFQCSTYEE